MDHHGWPRYGMDTVGTQILHTKNEVLDTIRCDTLPSLQYPGVKALTCLGPNQHKRSDWKFFHCKDVNLTMGITEDKVQPENYFNHSMATIRVVRMAKPV
eukprot:TRINITY_DN16513_c1_g1_i1.p1 TRINITY_DN16513_c1_g1~~TRINITY_DN16513_c1_g1_i1.p1  ORF type:complete len:100 (+),score=12.19 TRINITY_DN16513_c1_g1_i1:492-791(+)